MPRSAVLRVAGLALFRPSREPFYRYGASSVLALSIFVLSSIPGTSYPDVRVPFADKIVHALLYLPLGWLFARSACGVSIGKSDLGRGVLLGIIGGVAFGASDELHQLFVPMRSCSLDDWIIDALGVAVGGLAWAIWVSFSRWPEST